MTVQIVDIAGQKMAMLPIADYERLLDLIEDRADVAAATVAEQRRVDGEEYLPAALVDQLLNGDSPLRVWRKYRGMTLQQLGTTIGTTRMHVCRMEKHKQAGSLRLWRAAAAALDVSIDDIMPII